MLLKTIGIERPYLIIAGMWFALCATVSYAADPSPSGTTGISRGAPGTTDERPLLPKMEQPAVPALSLPPIGPKVAEDNKLSTKLQVYVSEFTFKGNQVFSTEDLKEIVEDYTGKMISSEKLQEARRKLTEYYRAAGYINSGAFIPDQDPSSRVIKIQIIEGTLTEVKVKGNKRLKENFIEERLMHGAGRPLDHNKLIESLKILRQNPLIEGISADLGPGNQRGEAILRTEVIESSAYRLGAIADNQLSPSVGDARLLVYGDVHSTLASGDNIYVELGYAQGLVDASAAYRLPVDHRDTTLHFLFDWTESDVVEEPLDELDIDSESWSAYFGVSYPWRRTSQSLFSIAMGLELQKSQTSLLGRPFPLSEGVEEDGESRLSVIRLTQNWWLSRKPSRVIAARSTVSIGIDALNATNNPDKPDGQFVSWLGSVQWLQQLGKKGAQLLFRAAGQWASDPLLPLEQFTVGGIYSVRGYRQNLLVRDQGLTMSLEYRIPLIRSSAARNALYFTPFIDAGGGWNRDRDNPDPDTISSVGIGLRWDSTDSINAQLYYGYALRDVDVPSDSLQDSGVHFLVHVGAEM